MYISFLKFYAYRKTNAIYFLENFIRFSRGGGWIRWKRVNYITMIGLIRIEGTFKRPSADTPLNLFTRHAYVSCLYSIQGKLHSYSVFHLYHSDATRWKIAIRKKYKNSQLISTSISFCLIEYVNTLAVFKSIWSLGVLTENKPQKTTNYIYPRQFDQVFWYHQFTVVIERKKCRGHVNAHFLTSKGSHYQTVARLETVRCVSNLLIRWKPNWLKCWDFLGPSAVFYL